MSGIIKYFFVSLFFSCFCYTQGTIRVNSFGEGYVNFAGFVPGGEVNGRVTLQGVPVGAPYKAALYVGPLGAEGSSLEYVYVTTGWRTGAAAGYWNPVQVTVPLPDSTRWVTMQVRVFEGTLWETSLCRGESNLIEVWLNSTANGVPPNMVGLQPFEVTCIPEPSADGLFFAAVGVLYLARGRFKRSRPGDFFPLYSSRL